jgi:hypothetical protein
VGNTPVTRSIGLAVRADGTIAYTTVVGRQGGAVIYDGFAQTHDLTTLDPSADTTVELQNLAPAANQ